MPLLACSNKFALAHGLLYDHTDLSCSTVDQQKFLADLAAWVIISRSP